MRFYIYKTADGNSEPLTKEKIELLVRTSELSIDDFVFITDIKEWKRIFEVEEFSNFILAPEAHEIKRWFIYDEHKKEKKGPFSTKEIISKLSFGEFSESDYLWSYETKEWQKLKDIEDFNKKTENTKKTTKQETSPSQKTEAKIIRQESEEQKTAPIKKLEPRIIKKQTLAKPKQKIKKKTKKHLNFIPELFFGLFLILIAYVRKTDLKSKDIYFYATGFIFIILALLTLNKARKKSKKEKENI